MNARHAFASLILLTALSQSQTASAAAWKPVAGTLTTEWTSKVDPAHVLPEYPRPQMVRDQWTNLNGLWDYSVTGLQDPAPTTYSGKILVPFCIESALSGVKKKFTPNDRLWYHRTFAAPDLAGGKRLLLHFGAVDYEAQVIVNGKAVGTHRGGYDEFTFDITDALRPGDNDLVVAVIDATSGTQARGKQKLDAIDHPGGIFYTPCSGIWQTVWMEVVSYDHINALKIMPNVDQREVSIAVLGDDYETRITVKDGDKVVATGSGPSRDPITLKIPNAKLWTPESPFLYDVEIKRGDDSVKSYFGMRKISLGKDEHGINRLMLNNKFVFQSGPLDQGFWPDGIYTAPTDEALKFDIEMTKKLGFNMTRKHVKIEPERWYYWCDKLGLLVWQDMPATFMAHSTRKKPSDQLPANEQAAAEQFERQLDQLISHHCNHPSIVMWVVFNEGWGQYDTVRLTKWVKQLDPSRLVNCASGWTDFPVGDVHDMHNYPGPGSPQPEERRAAVLGEFGGLGLPAPGHMWVDKSWGYRNMADRAALTAKYIELWKKVAELKQSPGLSAAVYTQLTDVETESNGLMTYDRRVVKVDLEKAAAAVGRGEFPPAPLTKDPSPGK